MKSATISLSLLGLIFLAGCSYTFNPKGQSTVSSIAILPLQNETSEFGLADRLTEFIVDAFIQDGNMKVLPETEAGSILEGKLLSYRRDVEQFTENDEVLEYKVVMSFALTLKNPDDDSAIWSETMSQEGIYDAQTETEEDGQRRAGERLVNAVLDKTTKSW